VKKCQKTAGRGGGYFLTHAVHRQWCVVLYYTPHSPRIRSGGVTWFLSRCTGKHLICLSITCCVCVCGQADIDITRLLSHYYITTLACPFPLTANHSTISYPPACPMYCPYRGLYEEHQTCTLWPRQAADEGQSTGNENNWEINTNWWTGRKLWAHPVHFWPLVQSFDAHCCHTGTVEKRPVVPDLVRPSFLTSGHSDVQGWAPCIYCTHFTWPGDVSYSSVERSSVRSPLIASYSTAIPFSVKDFFLDWSWFWDCIEWLLYLLTD